MNKKFIGIIVVLVALFSTMLFLARPAFAISNGEEDVANEYSNVGALVYQWIGDPEETKFLACSGVLIDSGVFLTAGHCYPPSEIVPYIEFFVTFDKEFDNGSEFIDVEDFIVDPEFDHDMGDLHDMAVIRLDEESTIGITPAKLPPLGLLNEMSKKYGLRDQDFVNVGYGAVPEWKEGPFRYEPPDGWRRVSTSPFMALTKSRLMLLMNNDATDQGGVCYGDSGGPHFMSEDSDYPNIVVTITTGGDAVCRALNYNYRLDTQKAREFLKDYVDLP